MIDCNPKFDWIPGNPGTDGYDNEDTIYKTTDDESEHKRIEEVQEKMLLEEKVDIHETLEDKDRIQKMGKDKYHNKDHNIILE